VVALNTWRKWRVGAEATTAGRASGPGSGERTCPGLGIIEPCLPLPAKALPSAGSVRSYAPKSEILRVDDPADRLYEVISGAICTYRMLKEGRRQIGGFYFSGDIFGLEAAEKHILTAQAITNAKVRISNKQAVNALMSRDVKLADQLLSVMARELARKQDHVLLLSRSAEDRIIYFLIEMSQRISSEENVIALPMTRQHIADYLGLTLETVSRILWDLERRGAIEIEGRRRIVLRNQYTNERPEKVVDLFEGITGRLPKSEQELGDWLVSTDGKAATVFKITSFSRWGDRARS
jgi:CRP/FNR family transcriptional regulator, nitrogen fixation regulation protein